MAGSWPSSGNRTAYNIPSDHLIYLATPPYSIDVGGKLLTNHLKQLVSFRQWNMMDETYLMEKVREECCYVSMDWRGDLEMCK